MWKNIWVGSPPIGNVHCPQPQLSSVVDMIMAANFQMLLLSMTTKPGSRSDLPNKARSGPSSNHLGAVGQLLYSVKKRGRRLIEKQKEMGGAAKARAAQPLQMTQTQLQTIIYPSKSDNQLWSHYSKSFNEMKRALSIAQ